jgi:hypothetical protein
MKNLCLATTIAVASLMAMTSTTLAASLTITTDDGPSYNEYRPRYYSEEYRPGYDGWHERQWHRRWQRVDCDVRTIWTWHDGYRVIRHIRYCR